MGDDFTWIFICCCGGGLVLLAIIGNGLYIRNVFRGRKAHMRLAEAGGYALLVDDNLDARKVYGGEANGRPFAFRPAADTYRSYDGDGSTSVRVKMLFQIIVPLNNPAFKEFRMLRNSKLKGVPATFDGIWTMKPAADPLSATVQQAIYTFAAENPHPAGLHWPSYRSKPIVRKLTILNRDGWGNGMPEALFPDAVSLLVYDHPNANLDLAELEKLASELTHLAKIVDG